jgi:hypothetical protein
MSTKVTESGLVTFEKFAVMYKNQALAIAATFNIHPNVNMKTKTWMTDVPLGSEPPAQIMVEGSGISCVNGIYVKDGLFQGFGKYSMHGMHEGKIHVLFLSSVVAMV